VKKTTTVVSTQDQVSEGEYTANLKTLAVKGGGANILAEVVLFVVHTLGVVVLARLLDPRAFGLVTMVAVFFLLLMNFGINGFTEYIIQKKSIDQTELGSIFWLHASISVFLALAFNACAALLSSFYKEPAVVPIVRVFSIGIVASMVSTYPKALLQRRMEFSKVALNAVIAGILSLALAVAMAVMGLGYWAVVARQLSNIVFMAVGAWILCPFNPGVPGRIKGVGAAVKYALNVYGNFLIGYLARNLDKVLLGRFFGSQTLGFYDRAYYASSMPVAQLVSPLNNVGLATLSRLRDDPARYISYYTKAVATLALLGVYASVVLALSGKDLMVVLLGPQWEPSGPIVQAFSVGIGAMIVYYTYSWIHLSLGNPQRWLRWSLVSTAFTAACLIIAVRYGPIVVAGVYSGSFFILMGPAIWYAGRPIGLRVKPILKQVVPFFVAGIVSCAIWVAAIHYPWGFSHFLGELGPFVRVCVVLLFSSAAYLGLVVAFHRNVKPLADLWSIVRLLFKRDRSGSVA